MDVEAQALPDHASYLQSAQQALAEDKTDDALRYLAVARSAPDAPVDAWLLAAQHCDDAGALVLLREAVARFPLIGRAHHDLARAAERCSDWVTADRAWRGFVAADPDTWWGYAELAEVLSRLDRRDEADSILREGINRLPNEVMLVIRRAHLAQLQDDWDLAQQLWEQVSKRSPERSEGFVGRSAALLRLGRYPEAREAATVGVRKYPELPQLLHDLARCAEWSEEWPVAEQSWRRFLALEPAMWWGHAGLALALARQQKLAEAEAVLEAARARFPDEINIAVAYAQLAETGGNLTVAAQHWDEVITRFPSAWAGYRGKAAVLAAAGQANEGATLLRNAAFHFLHEPDALHDLARVAEQSGDWAGAESAWRAALQANDKMSYAYIGLAHALDEQKRPEQAESVLLQAVRRFPADVAIATEAARLSQSRGDHLQAVERWAVVSRLQPWSPVGPIGEAAAFRQQGDYAAADRVIRAALERLAEEPKLHEAYILTAMNQGNWAEAKTRLSAAEARFPDHDVLRQRKFELQLRAADTGATAVVEDASIPAERALVLGFESLGGGGHGCEFGIFQRHFGAEPLGLLRWADIYQDALTAALNDEFAGVGEPEFTNLFVPPTNDRPEYWTTDTRYHMAMRCFVSADEVPLERMRVQVTKRLDYLRRKLIEDLKDGSKIFVYKNMKRNLTDAELEQLHTAVRRYGKNNLFYIRYEDADHPNGTVELAAPGLLIGYIDHFSHTPDTDVYIGSATDSLLNLCKKAHHLVFETNGTARSDTVADRAEPPAVFAQRWFARLAELKNRREFAAFEQAYSTLPPALLTDIGILGLWCDIPRLQQDWPETQRRAAIMAKAWPESWHPQVFEIDAAVGLHGYAAARSTIDKILAQWENEPYLLFAVSEVAFAAGDDATVIDCYERVRDIGERYLGSGFRHNYAVALERTGRRAEAASAVCDGLRTYPAEPILKALAHRLGVAEPEPEPEFVLPKLSAPRASYIPMPDDGAIEAATGLAVKELVLQFDTLGEDCTFGFIQRRAGAEPISLMRFAGMQWEEMVLALNTGFAGIDRPGNLMAEGQENVWDIRDRRYNISYHTFLEKSTTPKEELLATQGRRLRWLADKLMADLATDDKIFLAWRAVADRPLDIKPLFRAVRRHGNATIIMVAAEDGEPGAQEIAPGLLYGRVPSTRLNPTDDARGWLAMMANAWLLVKSSRNSTSQTEG